MRATVIGGAICLLVLGSLAILAVLQVREAARQTTMLNGLRQIGLAALNFESAYQRFPRASESQFPGGPEYSWAVDLLPFIESNTLYSEIDKRRPWDDLLNVPYTSRVYRPYLSPQESSQRDSAGFGVIHFAACDEVIVSKGAAREFDDGLSSNQFMVGEICEGYMPWAQPGNARSVETGIGFDATSFGSPGRQGAAFVLVDGSVRWVESERQRPIVRKSNRTEPAPASDPDREFKALKDLPCVVHRIRNRGLVVDVWFRDPAVDGDFRSKIAFFESGPPIPIAWIEKLQKVDGVIGISFRNNAVSSEGIQVLAGITGLEALRLGGDRLLTDDDLRQLHSLSNLRSLTILDGGFTDQAMAELKEALPDCEILVD